jgi:RimJ/RimL family protein N-acetyltransferase
MPADPGFTQLRTARLVIRRFRSQDLAVFAAYRSDPDVAKYQSWETYTVQEAEEFLRDMADAHPGTPGEWFQFAAAERESSELLGDVALRVDARDTSRAELGVTLATAHQGKGYATEAVRAVADYAFERLGATTVFAVADARNRASVALLERMGMRATTIERVRFKGEWCDEHTYELRRDGG